MTHHSLSIRPLPATGHRAAGDPVGLFVSDLVPGLVEQLRAADRSGRWRFHHVDAAGQQPAGIEVRFEAVPEAVDALERRLTRDSARLGLAVDVARTPERAAAGPSALSILTGDLALGLLGGERLAPADEFSVASLHLRLLTELLPERDRLPFLFLGWQHWSRALAPTARRDLHKRAGKEAQALFATTASTALDPVLRPVWARYAQDLRHTVRTTPTLNYELFDHAHEVHTRLGIGPEAAASAARALRSALTGPDHRDAQTAYQLVLGEAPVAA
ncbi:hypothetical protein AB0M57_17625 [Streptomyces sp. NPDC051597]|uniref:hypothetical protein n=1 Tax=Streptomyces sp. NPDC051597 TaxID=3155049 RepID=UPI00341659D8